MICHGFSNTDKIILDLLSSDTSYSVDYSFGQWPSNVYMVSTLKPHDNQLCVCLKSSNCLQADISFEQDAPIIPIPVLPTLTNKRLRK